MIYDKGQAYPEVLVQWLYLSGSFKSYQNYVDIEKC